MHSLLTNEGDRLKLRLGVRVSDSDLRLRIRCLHVDGLMGLAINI